MTDLEKIMVIAKENLDKDNLAKVENIEKIIKSMKHYISNDYDPLDDDTEEGSKFNRNADDLMDAVVLLMVQGGWKTAEIRETMQSSVGKTDKQMAAVREVIGNAWQKDQKKWEESLKNISHYTVTFLITYFDHEPEILYSVTDDFDAENLHSLFDLLDEGIEDDSINPEQNILLNRPIDHELGNVNIDYVIIRDADGKELYRDQEFNEKLVPVENRIV
jgi:hypothetical protein